MRRRKILRIIIGALSVLVLAVLIFCLIYHNAARMVWNNWTSPKVDMSTSAEWDSGESYVGVQYSDVSESDYVDLYVPYTENGNALPKLFVLIHGGGFVTNDSQSRQAQLMYRYFRDQGYACATVNYRLAQEAPYPGALCDCKAAIRFLRAHADEYGYDASSFAVWGESAGGYLAVMCSVTNDSEFMDVPYIGQEEAESDGSIVSAMPDVLVDYYGCVELTKKDADWKAEGVPNIILNIANSWLQGDVLEGYEDVESFWQRKNHEDMTEDDVAYSSPYTYIGENFEGGDGSVMAGHDESAAAAREALELDVWIAHGDSDITVPILQSERLSAALKEASGVDDVVYEVVAKAGHAGERMYMDEELAKVKEFLDEKLNQ